MREWIGSVRGKGVYDQTESRLIFERRIRKAVVSLFIVFFPGCCWRWTSGYGQGTTSLLLFPLFFDLTLEQIPKGRANLHSAVKADFDERQQRGLSTSNERSCFVWSSPIQIDRMCALICVCQSTKDVLVGPRQYLTSWTSG